MTELCTSEPDVRKSRGRFTMECLDPWNYEIGACVWPEQFATSLSADRYNQPRAIYVTFNLISGVFGGTCEKYWPMKAINGLIIELQLENPCECLGYRFVPMKEADVRTLPKPHGEEDDYLINNYMDGVTTDAAQLAAITSYADSWEKYVDSSTVDSQYLKGRTTFATGTTWQVEPTPASNSNDFKYIVTKPTIQLNRIAINGAVGDEIVNAGKRASPDGRLRVQTHSWRVLQSQILKNSNYFTYPIPINVSSLKAVFFTMTPSANIGNIARSKTQFIQRKLNAYQFYYGMDPILNQPCRVAYPGSEAFFELMRAWSVAHKTMDAPTLIKADEYNKNINQNRLGFFMQPNSCVYGIDLESFASKSNVMDSGVNTRHTELRIELFFDTLSQRDQLEMGDVTIRFYCMYDMFISINDADGSISTEY